MSCILVFRVFFSAPLPCLDNLVTQYNDVLSSILDTHAPVRTRTVTLRPVAAWYSEEINSLKKHRRRLERRWRRTKLSTDRQLFIAQCRAVHNLTCSSKKSYYTSLINDNQSDFKLLFKAIDNLLTESAIHLIHHAIRRQSSRISLLSSSLIR